LIIFNILLIYFFYNNILTNTILM